MASSSYSSSSSNLNNIKEKLSATGSSLYKMFTGIPEQAANLVTGIKNTTSNAVSSLSNTSSNPPPPSVPVAPKIGGNRKIHKSKSRKYKTNKSKSKKNKSKRTRKSKSRKYKK